MDPKGVWSAEAGAEQQFGSVGLGDQRRRRRAVRLAAQIARRPAASLPEQTGRWADTKAGYRLLAQEAVTFEALSAPHGQGTRETARLRETVRMVQDTSCLDFSGHRSTPGLGAIGDGDGYGLMLQSTLTVDPRGSGEVLGLAYQRLFVRKPTPEQETRTPRKKRRRESQIWLQSVREVGPGGTPRRWIHVTDRYSDNFEFFEACRQVPVDFVVRVAQDRRAALGHGAAQPTGLLMPLARELPGGGETTLTLRRRPTRKPREARLLVAWSPMTLFAPWLTKEATAPLSGWVVRVWEADPPADEEGIEWVLATSVPVEDGSAALTVASWYSLRWLVEEYHKCLKTGGSAERRQLEEGERLRACLALLAVTAVRLLQLKLWARDEPQRPAYPCAPTSPVTVLAAYRRPSAEGWTARDFWREEAKLGGFLGRKHDGDPGWQTIWRSWQKLDLVTLGACLVQSQGVKCG